MKFSILVASAFAALTIAAPTVAVEKRGIFATTAYNDLSISGGVAGNAQAEALAVFTKFGLDPNNLGSLTAGDLKFLSDVNGVCNDAEKGVYNAAVSAASGTAAESLQIGKIKNKVLKLTATMLRLQAEQAQGTDTSAEQAVEGKKLNNNISQDKGKAGIASTKLDFAGTVTAKA
ncbi:hypothetical protein BP6252_05581 [Coleophoma cylindrospora]|uniref:Small secreted protein n=1 Tax=Coleophoma cylindrospora TaxID=1849047 RepID=A0A3D8RU92_9HELO|nr:hypothetical protein BP6252_05581 [Coleophoma cylindrospora]